MICKQGFYPLSCPPPSGRGVLFFESHQHAITDGQNGGDEVGVGGDLFGEMADGFGAGIAISVVEWLTYHRRVTV